MQSDLVKIVLIFSALFSEPKNAMAKTWLIRVRNIT